MDENYPYLYAIKPLKKEFNDLKKISINVEEFTIGRGLGNAVVIEHIPISRKHCKIKKNRNNTWVLQDTSAFGICINGQKVIKGCDQVLNPDDVVQLDSTGDFIYKFCLQPIEYESPRKRIKLDNETCMDIMDNVRVKFEQSQNFEIDHLEEKIQNAKQRQTNSIILKDQLEHNMSRKIQQLKDGFALQIENLRGEKNDVEKQKCLLEQQRDTQVAAIKQEMENKIEELMQKIQKHNEIESKLVDENTLLKEKLVKEREEFLAELNRESTSKQGMLEQLEAKSKDQEVRRLREKQELEDNLKREMEQLRAAKEKELQDLEEQNRLRETQLEQELSEMRRHHEMQIQETVEKKIKAEQELQQKMIEMKKLSEEDRLKMESLNQAREEAERKLREEQENSKKSYEQLETKVATWETELSALASERIQLQANQSSDAITSLQNLIDKMNSKLKSVETEKDTLLKSLNTNGQAGEGTSTSKENTLIEFGELMENELQCVICGELFVIATTLGCSHTFCKYCISVWKEKKRECPICRSVITSECRSLVLDSFIEKMVLNLTNEMKTKREDMLKQRQELDAELLHRSTGPSTKRRGNSSDSDSNYTDNYSPEHYQEESEAEFNYLPFSEDSLTETETVSEDSDPPTPRAGSPTDRPAHEGDGLSATSGIDQYSREDGGSHRSASDGGVSVPGGRRRRRGLVPGVAGAYYGGYGRCFSCGALGHWAPGCPFT